MCENSKFIGHKYIILSLADLKGGYLDFLHLTELRNTNITEIYMKKKNQ